MKVRHVLSIADIGPENLSRLIDHSLAIAAGRAGEARRLAGKIVGIYFRGTSTRTRTAFTVGAMRLTLLTPEGYGLPANTLQTAERLASQSGSVVEQHHRRDRLPANVDVVYTTRWQTMGVSKADVNWREKFEPFRVTQELMAQV